MMKESSDLFDEFSECYQESLEQALRASGEGREYFAVGRVQWLKRCLDRLGESPRSVLDFGCGDGATSPLLKDLLLAGSLLGTDISPKSIDHAQRNFATSAIRYTTLKEFRPSGAMDLAYSNGVFHHILPAERPQNLSLVHSALRNGGLFSFWENNPWNPATRYVMSRIPFDRDALLLTPPEATQLLRKIGFEIVRVDYRFIFPRALRIFRKLEDVVYALPFGTQYQVLCRKPAGN